MAEVARNPAHKNVPLTEVVDFIGGSQPPKSQFSSTQSDGYVRLIQIRDYKTDAYKVYVKKSSTKKFCNADDVMIGRYGPPVFQILRGLEGAYNVALMKAVPNESVLFKEYLFWFLQCPSIQDYIIGLSQRAAGQSGVNKNALEKYKIFLPSLNEQKCIIAKLDALFTRINSAIDQLQQTLALSKALFASALVDAFSDHPSWQRTKVKDVFRVINGRAYKKPELLSQGKYKVVRIQNLKGGESYYYSDMELAEDKYCKAGDLVFSWSGTPGTSFGAFIWEGEKAIFHYHIWNMEPLVDIDMRFAYWLLRDLTEEAIAGSRGVAGMLHITKGMMETFDIAIPSTMEEQRLVAEKLDALSESTHALEEATQEKLDHLKSLKASLLDAAFRGQL